MNHVRTLAAMLLAFTLPATAEVAVALRTAAPAVIAKKAEPAAPTVPTNTLLLRLKRRMERIDREYARLAQPQMGEHLDEVEALLAQLRGRPLEKKQQIALFKTEMRVRSLRFDLAKGG